MLAKIEADTRIAALRNELADAKLTGIEDGINGGRVVFADFLSARYQREARIRKLLQCRRLQIRGTARDDRLEFLLHARHCRLVEKRLAEASPP